MLAFIDFSVLRRTLVYTVSGSLSALVAFFLLPILTRYLSPSDYGVVEMFTSLTACLSGIIIVGGNTILAKEYFNHTHSGRATLIGSILTIICISALGLFLLTAIVDIPTNAISRLLKLSDGLLYLAIFSSLANAIIALITTLLQIEKRATLYLGFVNSKTLIEILISLILTVSFSLKASGRIAGIAGSNILFAFLSLIWLWKRSVRATLSVCQARVLLVLGLPLVAAHVSVWVYGMVDRVMITNLFNLASTGIYSVGFRFGSVVAMVETAFSMAWLPYFYENVRLNDPQTDRRVVKFSCLYALILFTFAIGFGLLTRWLLPAMVNKRFDSATRFTMLICIAFWFSGTWKLFGNYLIIEGKTRMYGLITFAIAVFHIGLTYYLLKRVGVIGAAWATMFTFGAATTVTFIAALKVHPMPWACILDPLRNAGRKTK
jgi:O-antigen/teichoic acid export membrane protein